MITLVTLNCVTDVYLYRSCVGIYFALTVLASPYENVRFGGFIEYSLHILSFTLFLISERTQFRGQFDSPPPTTIVCTRTLRTVNTTLDNLTISDAYFTSLQSHIAHLLSTGDVTTLSSVSHQPSRRTRDTSRPVGPGWVACRPRCPPGCTGISTPPPPVPWAATPAT